DAHAEFPAEHANPCGLELHESGPATGAAGECLDLGERAHGGQSREASPTGAAELLSRADGGRDFLPACCYAAGAPILPWLSAGFSRDRRSILSPSKCRSAKRTTSASAPERHASTRNRHGDLPTHAHHDGPAGVRQSPGGSVRADRLAEDAEGIGSEGSPAASGFTGRE